ncbi:MAG: hypothetical protein WCB27_02165 [Thermoguttaceae bacterium]|jgi:hypothetical protein
MSIIVVCRGCLKSYKVSDKHAGKTAPCPNCKRPLQVPTKESEVKVHAPEEFGGGGKSTTGKLITKPIAHVNVRLKPTTAAILAASVAGVLAVTWSLGHAGLFDVDRVGVFHAVVTASVGLLLISPPLAVAAYEMLRDDEFEPFRGRSLYLRSAACGWAYASLWGAFAILSRYIVTGEVWNWFFVLPFLGVGALVPMGAFDLEFGDGLFHSGFYLVATLLLRWAAGMDPIWSAHL